MICGRHIRMCDPEVGELSDLLRAATPKVAATSARFRNPHGVARKIRRFTDHLAEHAEFALSPVEENLWQEYSSDPQGLAAAAAQVRHRLAAAGARGDFPSHGPPPSAIAAVGHEDQGVAWLYVAALFGIVTESNEIFVKVGRSNDVPRREADLNFALPRRLGLRWRMIASWRTPTEMAAHVAEQTILQSEAAAGRSAGGEFLLIASQGVGRLLHRCGRVIRSSLTEEEPARSQECKLRLRRAAGKIGSISSRSCAAGRRHSGNLGLSRSSRRRARRAPHRYERTGRA